jgi:hypothetical protein
MAAFWPGLMPCTSRLRPLLWSWLLAGLLTFGLGLPARAETVELLGLEVQRSEDGVLLDFATRFELPHSVEDALVRGVPLHFVAEAGLFRRRWYWADERVAHATRTWRISYQPLTLNYRVALGPLAQSYATLTEALAAVKSAAHWRIADAVPPNGGRYYVEFSYRLDTALLPRPLQFGLGDSVDWQLAVERTAPLPEAKP